MSDETPVTKEDIERLSAEIEEARQELNKLAESCRGIYSELGNLSTELLEKSCKLDKIILSFMKLEIRFKKSQKPLA